MSAGCEEEMQTGRVTDYEMGVVGTDKRSQGLADDDSVYPSQNQSQTASCPKHDRLSHTHACRGPVPWHQRR